MGFGFRFDRQKRADGQREDAEKVAADMVYNGIATCIRPVRPSPPPRRARRPPRDGRRVRRAIEVLIAKAGCA